MTACSVWRMIASRDATSLPARSGVHAVVMRRRALDGHGRERRGAGRFGELAAHVLTAGDALANQRRRRRRERVLARDPDGVRDAGRDVEVPLRDVRQAQRAGAAPRQLQRRGDADARLHHAAVRRHREALHQDPVGRARGHEDRIAPRAHHALVRAPGEVASGERRLVLLAVDPQRHARHHAAGRQRQLGARFARDGRVVLELERPLDVGDGGARVDRSIEARAAQRQAAPRDHADLVGALVHVPARVVLVPPAGQPGTDARRGLGLDRPARDAVVDLAGLVVRDRREDVQARRSTRSNAPRARLEAARSMRSRWPMRRSHAIPERLTAGSSDAARTSITRVSVAGMFSAISRPTPAASPPRIARRAGRPAARRKRRSAVSARSPAISDSSGRQRQQAETPEHHAEQRRRASSARRSPRRRPRSPTANACAKMTASMRAASRRFSTQSETTLASGTAAIANT